MEIRAWRWSLVAGLAITAGLAMPQRPAAAHALESSLERVSGLTDSLVLQSRFSSEEPARDAEVQLVSPSGRRIALGRTDASGTLRFQLPQGVGADWEVQVDQGPGHRDYLELPAAPAAGSAVRSAGPIKRTLTSTRTALLQPQPMGLAALVAIGGLGSAALRRRPR